MNKYEFTGEEKIEFGITFKRIRAKRDIPMHGVNAGDLGGWIVSEQNLDDESDAWVSGNARVSDNAHVYGNALVSGDAHVSGNAWVSGNAHVYGNAWVSDNAWVSGNARVSDNAHVYGNAWVSDNADILVIGPIGSRNAYTTFAKSETGILVFCGCFSGSIKDFEKKVTEIHAGTIHEKTYKLAISMAKAKMDNK